MTDDDYRGGEAAGTGPRTLSDAYKRDVYKLEIEKVSRRAVNEVKAAREALDIDAAREAARRALDERNTLRTATQKNLSWSGRKFSEAVERPRGWARQILKAEKEVLTLNPRATQYDVYEAIAKSAGKSNTTMGPLQLAFKGLGWLATGVAAVLILKNVWDAPPGEGLHVLGREAVGAGIGFVGSSLGSVMMVGILKSLGVAAAGPLAVAAIIGGASLALLADFAYRNLGERLGGRDPFAALLGVLAGLVLGTALGMPGHMPFLLGAADDHGRLPEATILLSYRDGDSTWTATLVATPAWSYSAPSRTLSIDMGNAVTNDYLTLRDVSRSAACQRAITGCGPDVGGIQVYHMGEARATLADGRTIVSHNGIQFVLPEDAKQLVRLEVDINRADTEFIAGSDNAIYETRTLTWRF